MEMRMSASIVAPSKTACWTYGIAMYEDSATK